MNKKELAVSIHKEGFNCAQAVFGAFAEDVGLDRETALKTAACFGGGMRCGEACGAVTGALMALGMRHGSASFTPESKQFAYSKSLEFIKRFREKNGAITCRDLLGYDVSKPEEMKIINEKGLNVTVCMKVIADAAEIVEELL